VYDTVAEPIPEALLARRNGILRIPVSGDWKADGSDSDEAGNSPNSEERQEDITEPLEGREREDTTKLE
jgi:hypothetical protein